jgi:hypothetical protein
MVRALLIGGMTLALAVSTGPDAAIAAGKVATVDPETGPLVITDFVGSDADFTGTVRLQAQEAVPSVRAHFSALVNDKDRTESIRPSNLSLSAVPALADDDVVDAEIKVEQVTVPGTYTGSVEFRAPGQKPGAKLDIRLVALARPTLSAVAPQDRVRGKLAHCTWPGCFITHALVPGSKGPRSQSVKFTVSANQKATITAISVVGLGDTTHHTLTAGALGLGAKPGRGDVEQTGDLLSLNLSVDPDDLPADHYTGTVRLQVENVEAPVTVPIDFSIRHAPLGVLLVMILGILAGRVSKYMQDRGQTLLDAFERAERLESRVKSLADDDKRVELLAKITSARAALERRDVDTAKTLLDEVDSDPALGPAAAPGLFTKVVKAASPLHSRLMLAAHLIALVIWAGVLVVGFQTLYVNNGATFGSNAVFDYIALFIWGLSAEVGTRGLGNVSGTAKK